MFDVAISLRVSIFSKSCFRPVRIALTLNEELQAYLRSVNDGIWLVGAWIDRSRLSATSCNEW